MSLIPTFQMALWNAWTASTVLRIMQSS